MVEINQDITPNKDGGVLKEIIKSGVGDETPFAGDNVIVHYTGTLLDGTKFDSSRDRGEKFKFDIGKGNVIKGWDIGIATMKRGEQSKFTIRSEYAYGEHGSGDKIGPNATLVFDVELFDFHGEDISREEDKSILKRTLKIGEGYSTPNEGSRVEVHLKGSHAGRVFDERNLEFEIGEGAKYDIINGIEEGLIKIKKGETARLTIKSKHAWGLKGFEKFGIPPSADVDYEIELKNFEKAKESWELNGVEKIEQSELLKNKGTELFKEGKYGLAAKKYARIVEFLEFEKSDDAENQKKISQLVLAAHLNVAMCNLKTNEYLKAIESCEKALKLEPNNEKALFRIAQANLSLANFDESVKFFNQVLEVNKENKEASKSILVAKQKLKEYNEREKKLYSKMFSGLGGKSDS